jgi:tetratricopeptide (TPR) repeat protein
VAAGIRAQVTPAETERLSRSRRIALSAQQLYLEASRRTEHRDEENLKRAIELYQSAIVLQPDFAEAYAGLARAWIERGIWGQTDFRMSEPPARAAALRALEIDPALGEAHAALGHSLAFFDWSWESAEKELRRAIELNPGSSYSHQILGTMLVALGRFPEAIAGGQRAVALDPKSSLMESSLGRTYFRARKYVDAEKHLKRALDLDPLSPGAHTRLAEVYQMTGKFPEALELLQRVTSVRGEDPERSIKLAALYAAMGRGSDARRILTNIDRPGIRSSDIGLVSAYLDLGNKDRAVYWLERAMDEREFAIYAAVDPRLDRLRADPRYQALVSRLRLPTRSPVHW